MKLRRFSIVIGLMLLVGAVVTNNYLASLKAEPKKKPELDKTPSVYYVEVSNDTIENRVEITGRLMARKKIQVTSEVQGVYRGGGKEFKEGVSFAKGEVLMNLEPGELRMNFYAQKSNFLNAISQIIPDLKIDYPEASEEWENYLNDFEMESPISDLPEVQHKQLKLFLTSRNILSQYYSLKAQEITLDKYNIKAPFDGMVTASMVNPGYVVRPGVVLGEFLSPDDFELEAALSVEDAEYVKVGDRVEMADEKGAQYVGKVIRKGGQIDVQTQNVKVYVAVQNASLQEGSYLSGAILGESIPSAIELDRRVLVNGKVYLINEDKLEPIEVKVQRYTRETAIITGLPEGVKVLDQSLNGAHRGMQVKLVQR